jgi:hypothetical protein
MENNATSHTCATSYESEGWYYTRLLLQRGRPGRLMLNGARLTFTTTARGERPAGPYEAMDATANTVFEFDLAEAETVSYNWLTGSVTIAHPNARHIVSFVGPPSGSTIRDARQLAVGFAALNRWRNVFTALQPSSDEVEVSS